LKYSRVDSSVLAKDYINIALIQIHLSEFDEAFQALQLGRQLARRHQVKIDIKLGYEVLAWYYANIGEYEKAYNAQVRYTQVFDSIIYNDNNLKMAELTKRYEQEKKDLKILNLNKTSQVQQLQLRQQRLIILAIILLLVGSTLAFLFLLQKRKLDFQKSLYSMQMKAENAKMSSHFNANAINAIRDYMNRHGVKAAETYVRKFGRLMRLVLDLSEEEVISLEKELEVLDNYLPLEAIRHENFEYDIDYGELDPATIFIPPLIIQTFVENAIKHGQARRKESGKLIVHISTHQELLLVTIEDNGIGEKAAEKIKVSLKEKDASHGILMSQERLSLMEKLTAVKASLNFEDLNQGLRVNLNLPINHKPSPV
jgi:hypothetical protein